MPEDPGEIPDIPKTPESPGKHRKVETDRRRAPENPQGQAAGNHESDPPPPVSMTRVIAPTDAPCIAFMHAIKYRLPKMMYVKMPKRDVPR